MWAVLQTGNKQYLVNEGDIIEVERLKETEGKVSLDTVLMVVDGDQVEIGTPYVKNARIIGEVIEEAKGEKVLVYKYRRRKKYRKLRGHRQIHTSLKISSITAK